MIFKISLLSFVYSNYKNGNNYKLATLIIKRRVYFNNLFNCITNTLLNNIFYLFRSELYPIYLSKLCIWNHKLKVVIFLLQNTDIICFV